MLHVGRRKMALVFVGLAVTCWTGCAVVVAWTVGGAAKLRDRQVPRETGGAGDSSSEQ
jgi:hypothetical protein